MKSISRAIAVALLVIVGQSGCRHYGPRSIVADRLPYNEAIAQSWKEQALLNVVKMRYLDPPFFVDVPQITSGYTIQGIVTANGSIVPPVNPLATFAQQLGANLNLQGAYQDRPTISYAPQTGSSFLRNLTTPINPGSVLYLLQSGYPADVVFALTVDSINGVRNRSVSGGQARPADPEFLHVVRTLRKAQIAGHVGIRVVRENDRDTVAFFFQDQDVDPEMAAELAEVRRALRLAPKEREFKVTFGAIAASPNEIAILSRSVIRIMQELSAFVDVPVEHVVQGIALPFPPEDGDASVPFQVLTSPTKPCNAFVAIRYEGHWFWIDKSDLRSKRTLSNLLVLLALADTGAKENLPVITIQAN